MNKIISFVVLISLWTGWFCLAVLSETEKISPPVVKPVVLEPGEVWYYPPEDE